MRYFLAPGSWSGISFTDHGSRIPDLYISESLLTIFWVKILHIFVNLQKFICLRDTGWDGKKSGSGIRDEHLGSVTPPISFLPCCVVCSWARMCKTSDAWLFGAITAPPSIRTSRTPRWRERPCPWTRSGSSRCLCRRCRSAAPPSLPRASSAPPCPRQRYANN